MIVTRKIALRIALILLAAVILQVSFFSYLSFFGSIPDFVPVVVASLGLLGGAVLGAVAGFAAGFVLDSVLLQTLGVSSLALLAIGYMAGRYREGYEVSRSSLTPPLIVGGLCLVYAALFSALQLMLGVSTPVSLVIVRDIVVKGLLGTLLALFTYPLVRRIVRPALVDDAAAARRRAPVRAAARRRLGRRRSRGMARATGIAGRSS